MLDFLLSILSLITKFFFKSSGDKAIQTVIDQKDEVIKEVSDAKKTTDRLDSDKSFTERVRSKYQRD